MKVEQKHRVAEKVVDAFRTKALRTHSDLYQYPLSLTALSIMVSEAYPIAIHEIEGLDVDKVIRVVGSCGGVFTPSALDRYVVLAGFLYAHLGGGMIFIERADSEERRKFSLVHELGHFVNDYYAPVYLKYEVGNTMPLFTEERTVEMQQVVAARCTERDIYGENEPVVKQIVGVEARQIIESIRREDAIRFNEIRANLFAAELLMPMEECKRIEYENQGSTQEEITLAVMKRFGVSHSAAAVRVEELRLGMVDQTFF